MEVRALCVVVVDCGKGLGCPWVCCLFFDVESGAILLRFVPADQSSFPSFCDVVGILVVRGKAACDAAFSTFGGDVAVVGCLRFDLARRRGENGVIVRC